MVVVPFVTSFTRWDRDCIPVPFIGRATLNNEMEQAHTTMRFFSMNALQKTGEKGKKNADVCVHSAAIEPPMFHLGEAQAVVVGSNRKALPRN
ncbi:hypothetical protein Poly41_70880 [Novipirellula artificiosorum]|uniref:Uncharacterized protein n=1 Tax=Novipirellula artificiosorum TaxID=2528016 RepID=A0A5C6CJ48_9BACT|nr:hypothetical protein Poly41_70880 [Novipirellula artificiosorum]